MAVTKTQLRRIVKSSNRGSLNQIKAAIRALAFSEVLVGFPEDTTAREDLGVQGITNAALGYIHDNGAPEQNIPARPFMVPAMADAQEPVSEMLGQLAEKVVRTNNPLLIERGLHIVGMRAELAIKNKINEGIPPPLADRTLRERNRRTKKGSKSAQKEMARRAQGLAPSTEFAKPLIDTGAMRNAVKYVIRARKERK